jgi:hypothetical protein
MGSGLCQEHVKIELKIIFPNITVLQGIATDSAFKATNLHSEPIVVNFRFEKPNEMDIWTRPGKWEDQIEPNESATIHYSVFANTQVNNETYTIKVWAEALERINDEPISSDKHPINVTVLFNPILYTTTTTTTTTSTTTTTILADKIRQDLLTRENLAIVVIIIFLGLIIVPYLSFKEEETPEYLEKDVETEEDELNDDEENE